MDTKKKNDAAPGTGGGPATVEENLRALLNLTRALKEAAAAGEFHRTATLMKEREQVLTLTTGIWKSGEKEKHDDILRVISAENTQLMAVLEDQRSSIGRRLEELRQERAITAYRQ